MGKIGAIVGFVTLMTVPGIAFAASTDVVGVTEGGLAAKALQAREFHIAVDTLKARSADAINDSARLINLGNAYVGLGRYDAARRAYVRALYSPDQVLLLADGSEAFSRDIAAKALGRLGTGAAMR